MTDAAPRIVLVDADRPSRRTTTAALRRQGYRVQATGSAVTASIWALSDPPDAVVADLWLPVVSGIQLCRLLRAEPATNEIPVLLQTAREVPRDRFWAERAGATAHLAKGDAASLARAIDHALAEAEHTVGFFLHLPSNRVDVLTRLAQHLDAALFDSVLRSEVRSLGSATDFAELFERLSTLVDQLFSCRWLALETTSGAFAVHVPSGEEAITKEEARALLIDRAERHSAPNASPPVVIPVRFAGEVIARLAGAPSARCSGAGSPSLRLVAEELGSVLRVIELTESTRRLASTDALTGLLNRRAFGDALTAARARAERSSEPLSLLLLDVDHFKSVNDTHGHQAGDRVLAAVGASLRREARAGDLAGRWGGEEFVVALPSCSEADARSVAERIRLACAALRVTRSSGLEIPITVSVGVAEFARDQSLEELVGCADAAMYAAKASGRNCCRTHSELLRALVAASLPPAALTCVA